MKNTDIKIEKGIPIPEKTYKWVDLFERMQSGDSFFVPDIKQAFSAKASLQSHIRRHKLSFQLRTNIQNEGVRFWKVRKQ